MKTKRRSKRYRGMRYQADPTAWIRTIVGNSEQPADNANDIIIKIRVAFELLKSGQASDDDFNRVASAMNIGMVRSESIDPLVEQTMQGGINAMYHCADIKERHGRYGFMGPAMLDLNDAIDCYEQILRGSTPKMMLDAQSTAADRMLEQVRLDKLKEL